MKTAVITGASRGIGLAAAKKFLTEGWFVIGTSTSGAMPIEDAKLTALKLDYLKPDTIAETVSAIRSAGKKIDVLVNNAGIWPDEEEKEEVNISISALRIVLEVNLIGTIDFTEQLLAASLIQDGGHIVSVGSMSGGITGEVGSMVPSYKISKVGLSMYTRTLAARLANRKVMVSIIDPGWVRTDMGGDEAPRDPKDAADEIFELATREQIETGQFWLNGSKRNW